MRTSMCATPLAAEPGCLRFELVAPKGDQGSLLFYELFESEAAFAFHCGSEHLRWFREARAPFVQDFPTVRECCRSRASRRAWSSWRPERDAGHLSP
ncbi:MAG: putative quinol monooxygenase [Geminicoccaceae bacterium]